MIVILLALGVSLGGCAREERLPPEPLLAEFESGMSLEAAKAVPSAKASNWEVTKPSDRSLDARAAPYQHLGHEGRIELNFVNDALARVFFSPVSPEAYVEKLSATLGIRLEPREGHDLSEQVSVVLLPTETGGVRVMWVHKALFQDLMTGP